LAYHLFQVGPVKGRGKKGWLKRFQISTQGIKVRFGLSKERKGSYWAPKEVI